MTAGEYKAQRIISDLGTEGLKALKAALDNSSLADDATLKSLTISKGTLAPAFSASTVSYTADVDNTTASVTVTPTANESHATVKVNGTDATSGSASSAVTLVAGDNTITIAVTAQNGDTKTYAITVTKAAA